MRRPSPAAPEPDVSPGGTQVAQASISESPLSRRQELPRNVAPVPFDSPSESSAECQWNGKAGSKCYDENEEHAEGLSLSSHKREYQTNNEASQEPHQA